WRVGDGNGQAAALVLQLAQGDTGRHPVARFGRSPPCPRSDQLGCPQMGESELELAVVELLGADLADLLILEGRSRVSAVPHRLEALDGFCSASLLVNRASGRSVSKRLA